MTSEIFVIGIAMLSRKRWWLLWKSARKRNGLPITRERANIDEVRILFQSMATLLEPDALVTIDRQEDDDEDLLDILFAIMQKRSLKSCYTRRDVLPGAKALPSSLSRRLYGWIALDDMSALLALSMDLHGRLLDISSKKTSCVLQGLLGSFSGFSCGNKHIFWEDFADTIYQSFVRCHHPTNFIPY